MSTLLRFSFALLLLLVPQGVFARDITADERVALDRTVEEFGTALRENDFDRVLATVPPRIFAFIAETAGLEVDLVRASTMEQMRLAMSTVTLDSFGMDLDGAEHHELADGTPYLLIETTMRMSAAGQATDVASSTLAMMDDGQWFLLRVTDLQQLEILRTVYPEFAGVEFPRGSMTAVEPAP